MYSISNDTFWVYILIDVDSVYLQDLKAIE